MHIYRRGDSGPVVAEIRAALARLGLIHEQVPGPAHPAAAAFDDDCDRAVRAFQQQRGLSVDGCVGAETYRALDEARWRLGDRVLSHVVARPFVGDDVASLQVRLLELGFDPGRADGQFGPDTDRALREFQRNVGLPPDGTCGPHTLRALRQLGRLVVGGRPALMRETERLHRAGPALAGKTVIVDAGHGGEDAGFGAAGVTERDLVADLADRLEGRLSAAGVYAYPTHRREQGRSDAERAAFANATAADLLLSLHIDAAPSPHCQGVATYYYGTWHGTGSAVGERLADLIRREIVARTDLVDCRSHPKTWELLRLTRMPAVRIDLGYLTNSSDVARLSTPHFRDVAAESILVGVQRLYLPEEADPPTGTLQLAV